MRKKMLGLVLLMKMLKTLRPKLFKRTSHLTKRVVKKMLIKAEKRKQTRQLI